MIFKDLIHYCQMGRGISTRGEHFCCSVVKTLKTKESTRTDTEGRLLLLCDPVASKHRLHSCHLHRFLLQAPPKNPVLPAWKMNHFFFFFQRKLRIDPRIQGRSNSSTSSHETGDNQGNKNKKIVWSNPTLTN